MLNILRFRILVRLFLCFFFLRIGIFFTYGQTLAPPAPTIVSDTLAAIWQDEVNNFGAEGGIMGIYLPGKWYWEGASGNALISPSSPASPDMNFRVGSLSKSLVAASLLKLQEQGTLDLDDLISLYLPANLISTIPNGTQIKIRQLLNHSSGIGNYTSSAGFITTLAIFGVGHVFTPEDLIGFGVAQGASFPPGNSWEYSNTNYVVAALVIEGAANMPYESFVDTNLLIPLGLSNSFYPTTDTLPGSFMGSYFDINNTPPKEDFTYVDPSGTFGAGALVSTLADIISWIYALNEGQVLSPASTNEMLTYINASWPNIDYGLGIGLYDNGTYSAIGHTGAVFNSSNMQFVGSKNYYVVYNVTDQEFPHFPFMDRLYAFLDPYLQNCTSFQPGNISGPALRGINVGETISLQGPIISGAEYQWLLNGQTISGAQSNAYQATLPGSYSLRISNQQGCVETSAEVILQDCSPYQVDINNVGQSAEYCLGTPVQLSAGGINDQVDWLDGNGLSLQTNSNTYDFFAQQNGRIIMKAEDNIGCKSRDSVDINILALPLADVGMDQQACRNTSINLQAGTAGNQTNWYDGNGNLLASNSLSYSFPLQNSQVIIAEVSNTCGIARDSVSVTLIPDPFIDLGNDFSNCLNAQVDLQAGNTGDETNWYNSSGNLLLGNSFSYSFPLTSNQSIIGEVRNTCGVVRDTVEIGLVQVPEADLGNDLALCFNTPVNLQAGEVSDQVNWYNQNGGILSTNSPTYNFALQAPGKIIVEVINLCGTATDTLSLEILNEARAELGADISECVNTPQMLETGQAGDSVVWYDLLGNILLNNSLSYSFTLQTSQLVIAEVNNICGQDRDTIFLEALTPPEAMLGPDFSSCIGTPLSFSMGNSGDLVNWFDGNGSLLLANSQTYDFTLNSSLSLVVERISTCGSTRDTVQIEANTIAAINLGIDQRVCTGETIILDAGNTPDQINWFDVNGTLLSSNVSELPIQVIQDQQIIAELISNCGTARDTVKLVAVDFPIVDLGPDTSILSGSRINLEAGQAGDIVNWYDGLGNLLLGNNTNFFINPQGPISLIAEVINPDNCIGRDTLFVDINTARFEPEIQGLFIYPNPSSAVLYLGWEDTDGLLWEWTIFNLKGQQVSNGKSYTNKERIDIQRFPEGIYLLHIRKGDRHMIKRISRID